jgi:hypothetical protein
MTETMRNKKLPLASSPAYVCYEGKTGALVASLESTRFTWGSMPDTATRSGWAGANIAPLPTPNALREMPDGDLVPRLSVHPL